MYFTLVQPNWYLKIRYRQKTCPQTTMALIDAMKQVHTGIHMHWIV